MEGRRITHNERMPLWFHLTISASAGIAIVASRDFVAPPHLTSRKLLRCAKPDRRLVARLRERLGRGIPLSDRRADPAADCCGAAGSEPRGGVHDRRQVPVVVPTAARIS